MLLVITLPLDLLLAACVLLEITERLLDSKVQAVRVFALMVNTQRLDPHPVLTALQEPGVFEEEHGNHILA